MRFRIPQDLIDEGLRAVGRAVSTKNTIPVLSGVYLRVSGQHLLLRASDLELTVHMALPTDVLDEGEIVLPARYLMELVRRLPPGVVEMQVEPGSSLARIGGPDCEYMVHGFPGDQFPAAPSPSGDQSVEIRVADLRRLFRETLFAVSRDESRPHLAGPAFAVTGSRASTMATNGAVLARSECPVIGSPENAVLQAILPGRVAQELLRLLGETTVESCSVGTVGKLLRFRLGDLSVISQVIDGTYPDLLRLLPSHYPSSVTVDRLSGESDGATGLRDLATRHQSRFMVAELDGQVKAYALSFVEGQHALFKSLVVDAGLRRSGIGWDLTCDSIRWSNGLGLPSRLRTQTDNQAARSLYERLGYHLTGHTRLVHRLLK